MTYQIILDALGDATRRIIFDRLCAGSCSVMALADGLPVSRPAVSQHLKTLKDAGLVTDRASGARRIYSVKEDGLAPLRAWLDSLGSETVFDYQAEIQRQMDERKNT